MQTTPLYARALAFLDDHAWIGPLLVRLVFGYFWLETGWAKLHNLAFFTERVPEEQVRHVLAIYGSTSRLQLACTSIEGGG